MTEVLNNINNTDDGYKTITDFYTKYKDIMFSTIDVSIQGFIEANMACPLGAVLDILKKNLNTIHLSVQNHGAQIILQKNNFLSAYGFEALADTNNTALPYERYKLTESSLFIKYVDKWLLGRTEMPQLSTGLHKEILKSIGEIFANASIHSNSEYVYVCGQFFPGKHLLYLTITDTGNGIKKTVNNARRTNYSSLEAIKWAMIDGNTTKPDTPGGYGFDILKRLILTNGGMLQIVSSDGLYQLCTEGEKTVLLNSEFPGTVISLQFKTNDNHSYRLRGENT